MADQDIERRRERGQRVEEIRRELGLRQPEFGARMTLTARDLGLVEAPRYTQTVVSELEGGRRRMTLDDVEVLAALDAEQRGELWIGWGREAVKLTQAELRRALSEAEAEAAERKRARGTRRVRRA